MDYTSERFIELAESAYARGTFTFTPFLSIAELSELMKLKKLPCMAHMALFGGAEGTERCVARFGDPEDAGYDAPFPIATVKIAPRSGKFSNELTHRDFLGAIMSLGVERETVGDIVVRDNTAHVFALERMAGYIAENLVSVSRTYVNCAVTDEVPEGALYTLSRETVQAASLRLDAVIAKAYKLSREDASALVTQGRVFINSSECLNESKTLNEGDIVSVRGSGRFVFRAVEGTSRKGKLKLMIEKYV